MKKIILACAALALTGTSLVSCCCDDKKTGDYTCTCEVKSCTDGVHVEIPPARYTGVTQGEASSRCSNLQATVVADYPGSTCSLQ